MDDVWRPITLLSSEALLIRTTLERISDMENIHSSILTITEMLMLMLVHEVHDLEMKI